MERGGFAGSSFSLSNNPQMSLAIVSSTDVMVLTHM